LTDGQNLIALDRYIRYVGRRAGTIEDRAAAEH
jgi:hypothetical protein